MDLWKTSSQLEILKKRAQIIQCIRSFFAKKNILEIETPLLSQTTNPEPNIESFEVPFGKKTYYLQTSPEFHMKRLIASGLGPIFQISKAFRQEELGLIHNPEFTLLEWYRPGFTYLQLMDEVEELLQLIFEHSAERVSYQSLFQNLLDLDPFSLSINHCQLFAGKNNLHVHSQEALTVDDWLDLFMSQLIEPQLKKMRIVFIYDYPSTQSALAQIRFDNPPVAERFEVYISGIELANGFQELVDSNEQLKRFQRDNNKRIQKNLKSVPIDNLFLEALKYMPPTSGVALGIDRLIMLALNCDKLADVQAFSFNNA